MSEITVDALMLAAQAKNFVSVAQDITDITRQNLSAIGAASGVLGSGPASQAFLTQYEPAVTDATQALSSLGPYAHNLAEALYNAFMAYTETDAALARDAPRL